MSLLSFLLVNAIGLSSPIFDQSLSNSCEFGRTSNCQRFPAKTPNINPTKIRCWNICNDLNITISIFPLKMEICMETYVKKNVKSPFFIQVALAAGYFWQKSEMALEASCLAENRNIPNILWPFKKLHMNTYEYYACLIYQTLEIHIILVYICMKSNCIWRWAGPALQQGCELLLWHLDLGDTFAILFFMAAACTRGVY